MVPHDTHHSLFHDVRTAYTPNIYSQIQQRHAQTRHLQNVIAQKYNNRSYFPDPSGSPIPLNKTMLFPLANASPTFSENFNTLPLST